MTDFVEEQPAGIETSVDPELAPAMRRLLDDEINDAFDREDRAALLARLGAQLPGPARGKAGVVLCRWADVQQVTRNPLVGMGDPTGQGYKGMGADHPLGPHSRDGDEQRRFRKTLEPVFSAQRVAGLTDDIRALANELIDTFVADGEVEFHDTFAVPLPCKIFLQVLGLPQDDLPELLRLKDGVIRVTGTDRSERQERSLAGGHELRAYLFEKLDERLAEDTRRDDLIDGFIHAAFGGQRLTRDEIVDVMHLFCLAGLDTVTSTLSCLVGWLAGHPEERDRVVHDPELLAAAVEELLRIETPVGIGTRYATADIEVSGFPIHAGEPIRAVWAAANLDPEQFPDPLVVDFDRPVKTHLTFASGFHRCLGSHLARLELRVGLEELHRRIPDYRIRPGAEPVWTDYGIRSAHPLPLVFTPGT